MSKNCLKQSFRCRGGPALFLVSVSIMIGILSLSFDSSAGSIFIIAAVLALQSPALAGIRTRSRHRLSRVAPPARAGAGQGRGSVAIFASGSRQSKLLCPLTRLDRVLTVSRGGG